MKRGHLALLSALALLLVAVFLLRGRRLGFERPTQQVTREPRNPETPRTIVQQPPADHTSLEHEPRLEPSQSFQVADTYSHLFKKFNAARKQFGPWGSHDKSSSFALDLTYGTLQARLLALSNPEEVESFALSIVQDSGADAEKVLFATKVLGILLAQGRKRAEEALKVLVQGTDQEVVPAALEALLANDKDGKERSLYWQICSKDFLPAFQCGPLWTDDPMKQGLQSRAAHYAALKQADYFSKEALARLSILESPQCAETLGSLVGGPNEQGRPDGWSREREEWALHVIQLRPTPGALGMLKDRLTRAENGGAGLIARGVVLPPPTDLSYPSWADKNYDKFLVAYLQLGGQLNEAETSRLTYFGYLGDPKERLQVLSTLK
jgi:hypothetical protein